MKKPIYLFDPKLKWSVFKKIWDKFPDTSGGPTPGALIDGKLIWEMLKERSINIYIDPKQKDDPIIFAFKLPKDRKIIVLSNPNFK